jgi:anti-sigma factor RsiW
MNDSLRSELEQYFDGELRRERQTLVEHLISEDSDARTYLEQLARLRTLARSHDPAVVRSAVRGFAPPSSRARIARVWAVATVSLAASVAAILILRIQTGFEASRARNTKTIATPALRAGAVNRPVKIQEVELYTWANQVQRRPDTAAKTVLLSRTRSGKRTAAAEMLALDLANAPSALAEELEPLAVLHKSAPGGRIRIERHTRRARSVAPGI